MYDGKVKRMGRNVGKNCRLQKGNRYSHRQRVKRSNSSRDYNIGGSKQWELRKYNPTTPGLRGMTVSTFEEITTSTPEKSLTVTLKKHAGRNNRGKITVRHQRRRHTDRNTESSISREIKTVFREQ